MATASDPPPAGTARAPARWRRWRAGLVLGAVVFVIHSLSPSPQSGDSRLSLVVAWQLLTTGSIDLSGIPTVEGLAWTGDLISTADGRLVPFFPWPPMLLALPGALILAAVGVDPAALSISDPNLTWIVEVPTASLIVAVTAVVIRRLVLDAGDRWSTPGTAWIAAGAFAFATIAWSTGSRALWQQTVSMLVLVLALLAIQRRGRGGAWPYLIGVFAALALVVRPTNVVIVVPLLAWMLVAAKPHALRGLLGGAAVLIAFLGLSWVFYGTALPPYYLPTRLGDTPVYDLVESLAVHLVSPGRGLLIYVPIALLALVGVGLRMATRTMSGLQVALGIGIIAQIGIIAKFGSTNGFTYGPRLLLDIVPLLVLLAVPTLAALPRPGGHRERRPLAVLAAVGVVAVLGWGLFVNATGAATRAAVCWNVTPIAIDTAPERVWDWSDPPFLRPWHDLASGGAFFVGSCTS